MDEETINQARAHIYATEYTSARDRISQLQEDILIEEKRFKGMLRWGFVLDIIVLIFIRNHMFSEDTPLAFTLVMTGIILLFYFAIPSGLIAIWRKFTEKGFSFIGSMTIMVILFVFLVAISMVIGWPSIFRQKKRISNLEAELVEAQKHFEESKAKVNL